MTILVTGGRGSVARSVVEQLLSAGEKPRVISRDPAATRLPEQIEVVRGDLAEPPESVLDGVSAVFLYADRGGVGGFLDAARTAGVEHVVLLSANVVTTPGAPDDPLIRLHASAERAVLDSGLAWTFLRPGGFATNALAWAGSIRARGVVEAPYPDAHADLIHEADIADAAVRALTEPGHEGRAYPLSGPQSITQREQAEAIAEAIGRPVEFVPQSPDEYRATMAEHGMGYLADTLLRYLAGQDGRPLPVVNTVEVLTGRPARTFAQWAADHASDFR
ncbi:NAD(P)H-binding protein [Saccharopolyspora sp. NPDC050642]|uniref:NAD(P)H-binding protein n=1 Tax=Saccharopolyspora sp. NPDC050642 TaxID=3157099 RepID=UPI0033EF9171